MAWTTSQRKGQLPADWPQRRTVVLQRDRHRCRCTTDGCHNNPGMCGASATQVDHEVPGNDHRLTNLRALCAPCHKTKTNLESQQARGVGPLRKRPAEAHPGLA